MPSITPAAVHQIREAASSSGAAEMALRIAAHFDQAANEMHYGIGFDEQREQDQTYEAHGIKLLVSPLSAEAVEHLTIDYVEIAPGDFRFIFYRADELAPDGAAAKPAGACGSGGCGACT